MEGIIIPLKFAVPLIILSWIIGKFLVDRLFDGPLLKYEDQRPDITGPLTKLIARIRYKLQREKYPNNHFVVFEIKLWDAIKAAKKFIFSTPLVQLGGINARAKDKITPVAFPNLTQREKRKIKKVMFRAVEDKLLTEFVNDLTKAGYAIEP